MQMTDLSFLLYFLPIMLVVYFALSFSTRIQNLWLALSVLVLYAFGSITYLVLIFAISMGNYYMGYVMQQKRESKKSAKLSIAVAILLNLSPLFFFVHLPQLMGMATDLFDFSAPVMPIAPLGISFIALQGISYVMDIYRGKAQWNHRFAESVIYLAFFPPLQAGPVIRYQEMASEIASRKPHLDDITDGAGRFVIGLGKVVLLSSTLLRVASIVFEQSNNSGIYTTVPISLAILGLVAYALGLYHYLSGFSDIVIGFGRILGFRYPENFNYPILASSISSFWKRYFISLETWFNEYVYQSLAKQRTNNDKMVLHLFLMWIGIGLWVGAGGPGLLFGVLCFTFILIERIVEVDPQRESKHPLRYFYVFCVVAILLIALKSNSIYQFTLFVANLFGMRENGFYSELAVSLVKESWYVFVVGFICCLPIGAKLRKAGEDSGNFIGKLAYGFYPFAMAGVVVLTLITLTQAGYDPNQSTSLFLWR